MTQSYLFLVCFLLSFSKKFFHKVCIETCQGQLTFWEIVRAVLTPPLLHDSLFSSSTHAQPLALAHSLFLTHHLLHHILQFPLHPLQLPPSSSASTTPTPHTHPLPLCFPSLTLYVHLTCSSTHTPPPKSLPLKQRISSSTSHSSTLEYVPHQLILPYLFPFTSQTPLHTVSSHAGKNTE